MRENETSAFRDASKAKNQMRMAKSRANESPAEKSARNAKNQKRMSESRINESPDEKAARQTKDRHNTASSRKLKFLVEKENISSSMSSSNNKDTLAMDLSDVDFSIIGTRDEEAALFTSISSVESPTASIQRSTGTAGRSTATITSRSTTSTSLSSLTTITTTDHLHFIGPMTNICEHCSALRFPKEKLNCCHSGKVNLDNIVYPEELKKLFEIRNFMSNIRAYNSSFAFASLGANIVSPSGFGPYCFKIHGQIYHRSGTLHPANDESCRFGQLYILDGADAIQLRTQYNPDLSLDILETIQKYLDLYNPYVTMYKKMADVEAAEQRRAADAGEPPALVKMVFAEGNDKRRYNAPTNEVAAVFIGNDGAPPGNHDIVVYPYNEPLHNISYLNMHCDPMIYPILFPNGETGWNPSMQHNPNFATSKRTKTTQLQYYSYRLAIRNQFSAIHHAGKLMQQYVVDAYVKTEAERLNFIATHQSQLRVDCYQGLMDHVYAQASNLNVAVGRIVILPSSFSGSPRNMQQNYQDAMAIVSCKGKPDLFLTMTCNPKWREIVENLLSGQYAADRPDLVSRVFNMKLSQLLSDLSDRELLGKIVAMVHVVEFQKRGLPHAHILLWLSDNDKLRTADDINRLISAEIPDFKTNPLLHKIVKDAMMHGPCGVVDGKMFDKIQCQESGKCTKHFPKSFSQSTLMCSDGYPIYQRRFDDRYVEVKGCRLDNRWVVPYNPILLLRYNCHINLEACMSIKSVKYLFKYVYKGHDCINLELITHDEIKMYLDARYVSAPEAFWRLSEYELHGKSHTIYRLPVHLPSMQNIYFQTGREEEALMNNSSTKLTAWFELNQNDPSANAYLYTEIPKHFIFQAKQKVWKPRKRGSDKMISRMYSVSPLDREKFALRCLLLHVRGATSYTDVRTYDSVEYETFTQACIARGLLDDDQIWNHTMSEGVTLLMPRQCRQLFATILTHCQPSDPLSLWNSFKAQLAEDYARNFSLEIAVQCALVDIQQRLSESGTNCADRGIPTPNPDMIIPSVSDTAFDDNAIANRNMAILNDDQRAVVNEILHEAIHGNRNKPNLHYLDGPAGTGKTMVFNTLISLLKSKGLSVAACAWTGIASILLQTGITVHSLFKLPVPILDTSSCKVSPSSDHGQYLKSLSLILIDEASMIPNDATNAIDRLFKDIMNNNIPFGGKLVLFGGDFRQVLPVVVRGTPTKIIEACLKTSPLWHHFVVHKLTKNMRALEEEQEFSKWLLKLGNGELVSSSVPRDGMIDIPVECIKADLVNELFPDFNVDRSMSVILTPKNDASLKLNNDILERLPGSNMEFMSCDTAICDTDEEAQNYSVEFLNSITPTGMPPHRLVLKQGCTVMLLRNLNSKRGLCNGVRLEVLKIFSHLLHCKILSGSNIDEQVLIPKLKLAPSDANLPFTLQRIQFPLRLSYSMTINKSQGQTFHNVGILLEDHVFSHGQLYVAFSRARTLRSVKVKIGKDSKRSESVTKNVVFKDILYF